MLNKVATVKKVAVFVLLLVGLVLPSGTGLTHPPVPLDVAGVRLGLEGQNEWRPQCYGCHIDEPIYPIRLTNYEPNLGELNCFDYSEDFNYCMSHTASLIPWESAWGFSAACPQEWPIGTWVVISGVGSFVCLDRGGMVVCDDDKKQCAVDILGPGGAWWNGALFDDAKLLVPIKPNYGGGE